ncbi:MAG: Fic family protein, partial [Bacilli bacterium]|nr:Fic family protein [Bacilli bacterium]
MRTFDYESLVVKSWDSEIVELIAKIHEYKGKQELYIRQKPTELKRLVEYAKIQSIEFSNKIEGIITTSTRMKQLVNEKVAPRNRDEKEIAGYRDVLNTIHESYEYISVKSNNILQLHRDLLKTAGFSFCGQYKNVQNYIQEELADGTKTIRFKPLEPYETPGAIDAICESYSRIISTEKVDPLLVIPTFICDFLCIHPFNDGNGRMGRLLTLLLLYQNGYQVGKYISIEKEIEKNKDAYYDALQAADENWLEGNNNPIPFIKYLLRIILSCYIKFEERVEDIGTKIKSSPYDIVKAYIVKKLGKFTAADIIVGCPSIGRSSILAATKKLVDEGFISKKGLGKTTFYVK